MPRQRLSRVLRDSSDVERSSETQISDEASVREFYDDGTSHQSRFRKHNLEVTPDGWLIAATGGQFGYHVTGELPGGQLEQHGMRAPPGGQFWQLGMEAPLMVNISSLA